MNTHLNPPRRALVLLLLCFGVRGDPKVTLAAVDAAPKTVKIGADFPGGNIVLEKIEGDTVFVHQDLRDTPSWFYWCFRVRGAAGRMLTFRFTKGDVIGVRGPAVSTDQGKTWRWLGAEVVKDASFAYSFPSDAAEVRFCVGTPYQEEHLNAFLAKQVNGPNLKVETLCKTKKGRDTELLRFGRLEGEPAHRVFLTARHHCCESLASYAMEGLVDFVLTDGQDGAWLREHVEFLAVPFMDKDGVEDGDQGKNRRPHDHNRDYIQEIYPSVKAVKEKVPAWSGGKLRVALDLHCPWLRGAQHEMIHFVGGVDQENWKRATQLAQILESVRKGPLVYRVSDNLAFGQAWNKAENVAKGGKLKSCSAWAAELPGIRVACGIELPYANARGGEVNAETARAFGRDLARAIRRYLEADE